MVKIESLKDYEKEFDYFLSRLNLAKSFLDCRSIQFMNESKFKLKKIFEKK